MRLKIKSFADAGDADKERIVLEATSDGDIGSFILLRSKAAENGVSPISGRKNAYWLPDRNVKNGDLVVVYTKRGSAAKKPLPAGRTAHFFYWHLSEPIWGEAQKNVAVLVDARDWDSVAPPSD